jgi:hypothetical protein
MLANAARRDGDLSQMRAARKLWRIAQGEIPFPDLPEPPKVA